jgi:hypothetical protein
LAIFSRACSLGNLVVRIDKNEKKQEKMKRKAAAEVKSSMILDNDRLLTWKEVMTMRQNPKRLAEVLKMCWEVLFAMCGVLCPLMLQ